MSLWQPTQATAPYQVTYSTNQHAAKGMVDGQDPAWSEREAKAIALVRVQNSGIPGTALVWLMLEEGPRCLYKVWMDFDARLFHVDNPEVAE